MTAGLKVLPDVELLVIDGLKADFDVADLVDDRVWWRIPAAPVSPFLLVTLIGGAAKIRGHLSAARIQIDSYADDKETASLVARVAQLALQRLENWSHPADEGVVCGVVEALGPIWLPDPVTNQPRYVGDFVVHAHPDRNPGS